ncbi:MULTISPECIES: Asp-tRNA(Asn)/Glu-tRNA(Gln) amidotransferase subunit GatA [Dialister]|mgnify:FL=1|uniref:Glutamyl-tRNA(Gln) amidotransferase subunit A n=1 Tax=Dialister hominis TaxID=2582419 RepID=A0A8E3ZJP9_9FIRM|nr:MULTISPECIES: Asp-tRNA(Asn)/Glu-tRNA(Gln) amidotransferase subunit GatA [Dialister]MBS6412574.1 Asp-tRNA(Asn)/Glu-tRNA(Gln) amidotransferase subunit GatA [Dialister sp.]MCH3912220.1 Asp-tRNA(Asn)/Glu-tRNA(Gln) amidotransferase subunit GatA [Dialister sp.]MCH3930024.1 Asp-tRNA(Asn)/Glu-tRNA(Gln) amidotransferase subunit GatA [Dialister sp.]MEE1348939.1 Asp-tRNA(Asn)/Glu-tRNA(Gln) amidotransferase subunit GatA [Dialister hominis]BBK25160.1 glutamyl-tRNA(Gln) amidotransferase subunit A [Dialis
MNFTIHDLHAQLVNKEISAVELTKKVIAHRDSVEKDVHAYLSLSDAKALEKAAEVDAKIAAGEEISDLAGIPGAIKDNICISGETCTAASRMLEHWVAPYDATVIEKLKQQDFISIGKTNMDEFAMGSSTENSAFGPTRNPWNLDYVPGGSSGGSAAAVAAIEAVWALGSDTGGSIRQPASFNGIVGLKPTYGLVSRYGLLAFASSLDQIGGLTKDVTDAAILLNAIAGYDAKDSTSIPQDKKDYKKALVNNVKGMKIGVPREFFGEGIKPETKEAVKKALAFYEKEGAELVDVSIPHINSGVSVYYIIAPAEASSNLARYDGVGFGYRAEGKDIIDMYIKTRSTGFGEEVKRRIMLGNYVLSAGYYDAYYLKALKVRTLLKQEFDEVYKSCDVIAAPSASGTSFKFGAFSDPLSLYMEDICTVPVNLIGAPSISIPVGFHEGMPLGMQLIGKPLGEETIIQAAYTFEQSHPEFTQIAPKGEIKA